MRDRAVAKGAHVGDGISGYLLTVDPTTLKTTWANHNVEAEMSRREQPSAVGRDVSEVVYLAEEIGLIEACKRVAATGLTEHLETMSFSVQGTRSRTLGSVYLLPCGDLLVASEWVQEAE